MRYTLKELFIGYLPRPKRLYRVLQDLDSGGGGGGGSYDDTEIKRRMTAVENGKQDKLVAGQNITISANTIAAKNIIDDTKNSLTTVWSSNKVKALFESLEGGVDIVITATRPAKSAAVEKTMYYVGSTAPYHIWFFLNDDWVDFGTTEISLENYYTKAEVDELLDDKVDKETGKVLIPLEDLAQITTNKNDITNIKDDANLTSFSKVKLEFDKKQDKITDSTLDSISDSTTVSSVSATSKTNKTFSLSALWDWIVGKLTSNTEKGIQVSEGKLGHSNAITVPTAKRILQATYDEQGHVKTIETEFNWSNNYLNSAENQLFTRKGANNLYNWAKVTDASSSDAVTTTGMDSALTRTSGSHQSTVSRVMKHCGVVSLQYFGQYSASKAISGKFTCIGSVPDDYKPASQTAIQVTTWNATPAGCASGYVTTGGKIYVWVSSIASGATNIQYVINATWKAA